MVDVLAVHDKLTVCCIGAAPVPARASATGAFVALLAKDTLPELAPPACGVNVTMNVALCPAFKVRGSVKPPSLNSALFDAAPEIVTPAPLAVMVALMFEFCPTATFPKFNVVGVMLSCPGLDPEPVRPMLRFVLPAVAIRFPVTEAADWGVNVILNVRLCPAVSVIGRLRPLMANPVPVNEMFEIVILEPPELVISSDLV